MRSKVKLLRQWTTGATCGSCRITENYLTRALLSMTRFPKMVENDNYLALRKDAIAPYPYRIIELALRGMEKILAHGMDAFLSDGELIRIVAQLRHLPCGKKCCSRSNC